VLLDDFSPEGVAAQWDAIRDLSSLTTPVDATDYWRMIQAKTGATG